MIAERDRARVPRWERVWLSLVVVACLLTLAGAPLPHVDSDSALFGKIARHILVTGEWLTLSHPNMPGYIVDKPPLTFWIMAASLRLGGDTNAALRAWQLLLSVGLVWLTYRFARLGAGIEESLLAALLMATFQQVFYFSMAPQHDVPLAFFLTLAFSAYHAYRQRGGMRRAALTGLWVALAVLTKGILWIGVVLLIIGADLLVSRRQGAPGHWRWDQVGAGAAVCLAVAAPWFVAGVLRQGEPFVQTFLLQENGIARFLRPFLGPGVVPVGWRPLLLLAYVPILMLGMLPWTGWLPGAVAEGWRSLRAGPPSVRLCAVWAGAFFALLSASQGDRIMRYLLPLYPPLAVLAARALRASLEAPRRLRRAAGLSLAALALIPATGWVYYLRYPDDIRVYLTVVAPPLVLFGLAVMALAAAAVARPGRAAVVALTVGALAAYAVMYGMIMTRWDRIWPWPAMTSIVNRLYRPGDRVLVVGSSGAETNFASYWIAARVEGADEAALARAWRETRVFALLAPGVAPRWNADAGARVLVKTPLGWTLVTNR